MDRKFLKSLVFIILCVFELISILLLRFLVIVDNINLLLNFYLFIVKY